MSNRFARPAAHAAILCLVLLAGLSPHSALAQQQPPWQTNIAKIGHLPLSGYAIDVAVSNNRAYVLSRRGPSTSFFPEAWVSVIDIANPARPTLLSIMTVGDSRDRIVIDGNRAAVFGGSANIDLIDFNHPLDLHHVLLTENFVGSADIDGNFLYSAELRAGRNEVRIYDISDIASPVFRGAIGSIGGGFVAARDNIVFYRDVTSAPEMLFTFDATNPANPAFLAGFPLSTHSGPAGPFHIQGRRLISVSQRDVDFFDIGNPAAVYSFPPIYTQPQDLAPLHSYAYVASENQILAIDTADLFDDDYLLGMLQTPGRVLGVDTYGAYCVAACGYQGLHIVNYTGTGALIRFGSPFAGKYALNTQLAVQFSSKGEAGTAVRLELWQGRERIKGLGLFWNPQGDHSASIPLGPVIAPGDGYFLRAVSLWNTTIFADSAEFDVLP